MKNYLLTLFTLTALLLAGCKKDDPGGSGGVDIPVTDVTINQNYILLNLADSEGGGDRLTLQGSVLPADASDPTLVWSSENPDIAAVDPSTGAVTAKSAGETVIMATSRQSEISASCNVRVVEDVETYFKTKLRAAFEAMPDAGPFLAAEWDENAPLNSWYGVSYHKTEWGYSLTLSLYYTGAGSSAPIFQLNDALLAITEISYMDLAPLTGSIPESIGNLTNLTNLELYDTELSGPIPESIGNLTNLTKLDLSNNLLSGQIPASIGKLTNLTELYLANNDLSGQIPESIGNLTGLTDLELYDNKLSGPIPESIGNLTNLTKLYLANNNLSGQIPESIGNLTGLNYLYLTGNRLEGSIPESLKQSAYFANFEFNPQQDGFEITGTEPGDADKAALLKIKDAWGDQAPQEVKETWTEENPISAFVGISTNGLGEVTQISFRNIKLPSLPDFSEFETVNKLNLYNNGLSGDVPEWIGKLTNLAQLSINDNRYSGEIPEWIGTLTKLKELELSSNNLSGQIPESIGNLANLEHVELNNNQLSGEIPESIGNLERLTWLSLCENLLSGEIPVSIGNLVNLEHLELNNNQLSGEIPESIGNLKRLTWISLYENLLSGEIPASIGNLVNLEQLELNTNQLSGEIPESIGNLKQLTWISLYENLLSGEIPASIGNLSQLETLYLDHNNLSGQIPESIGNLSQLEDLYLDHNNLSGQIPESILNNPNFSQWVLTPQNDGYGFTNYPEQPGN